MGTRRVLAGLFVALAPFQNCGQFQSADMVTQSSLAQCRAGYASQALRLQTVQHLDLTCADARAYACERRVFAPNAPDARDADVTQSSECAIAAEGGCVDVVTRTFGTAGARTADNVAQFAPGGDYNHVEVRCFHRWTYRGQVVLENEAASIADAFANVRQACLNAQSARTGDQ